MFFGAKAVPVCLAKSRFLAIAITGILVGVVPALSPRTAACQTTEANLEKY